MNYEFLFDADHMDSIDPDGTTWRELYTVESLAILQELPL